MHPADFTPLERAVLNAIVVQHPSEERLLRSQLAAARVVSRENTGGGFYTTFKVTAEGVQPLISRGPLGHVDAEVEGLEFGMGFLISLHEGYVSFLEGYSYEEDTSTLDFSSVDFVDFKLPKSRPRPPA